MAVSCALERTFRAREKSHQTALTACTRGSAKIGRSSSIPIRALARTHPSRWDPLSAAEKLKPQRAKGRVLVVDDEESVRSFTARVLRDAGYEVAMAADGPEALQIADREAPFDLCVIDLMI